MDTNRSDPTYSLISNPDGAVLCKFTCLEDAEAMATHLNHKARGLSQRSYLIRRPNECGSGTVTWWPEFGLNGKVAHYACCVDDDSPGPLSDRIIAGEGEARS